MKKEGDKEVEEDLTFPDFYNEDVIKNIWNEYYKRVYLNWKSKKKTK